MDILSAFLTSILSVAVLYLIAKLLGYRQISQMSVFDYINGITIGSIAAELATAKGWGNIVCLLVALAVYGAATMLSAYLTCKIPRLRSAVAGKPLLLYKNGEFYAENFRLARIDLHEFLMLCRNNGLFCLSDAENVLFEANGQLSILYKSDCRPAEPRDLGLSPSEEMQEADVILDGRVNSAALDYLGKNGEWLALELEKQGRTGIDGIYLATASRGGNLTVYPRVRGKGEERQM